MKEIKEILNEIETPYEWLSLRELRNDLTHEYPQFDDDIPMLNDNAIYYTSNGVN